MIFYQESRKAGKEIAFGVVQNVATPNRVNPVNEVTHPADYSGLSGSMIGTSGDGVVGVVGVTGSGVWLGSGAGRRPGFDVADCWERARTSDLPTAKTSVLGVTGSGSNQ